MANTVTVTPAQTGGRQLPGRITAVGTCDTTGELFRINGVAGLQKFRAQLQSTAKAGTSPTLDVKMQDSVDGGVTWNDLASFSFTQLTGAGVPHVDTVVAYSAGNGDIIRAFGTIGGSAGPSISYQLDVVAQS